MVELVGENVYKFVKFVSPLGIDFSVCTHFGKVFTTNNFILFAWKNDKSYFNPIFLRVVSN